MNNLEKLLTVQEVADKLKVTPQYARKLISEEKLQATRIGKQWVVNPEDLDKYIKEYDEMMKDQQGKQEETNSDMLAPADDLPF